MSYDQTCLGGTVKVSVNVIGHLTIKFFHFNTGLPSASDRVLELETHGLSHDFQRFFREWNQGTKVNTVS